MSKLFQIKEDDLASLEQLLPAIANRHMGCLGLADKIAIRQLQRILTNVRWNYGPPRCVEETE